MVNGYFDRLGNQRFASVELFFLLVLFKWLTIFFDVPDNQGFALVGLFFLPVLSKWLTVFSMCLSISGLHWWNYFFASVV